MTVQPPRIAVYGDVNLNLIDGSSIWLTSLVQTMVFASDVEVTVLLAAPNVRSLLTAPLRELPNVRIVSPPNADPRSQRKMQPTAAVDALEALDRDHHFDAIILRGFSVCTAAASRAHLRGRLWCYLTDIPQNLLELNDEVLERLSSIANASQFILCQTEQLRSFVETHVPEARRKTALLPPMIPSATSRHRKRRDNIKRMVYAGKFAPLWACEELLECFAQLRRRHDNVELHIFGDKIHNPVGEPDYLPRIQKALRTTAGVVWHRGTSREQVMEGLGDMDLAWGWRRAGLDNNLELSTKILEYGVSGVPVVLSRNSMHEKLLGSGYPLMASSPEEALDACDLLWSDPQSVAKAAEQIRAVSESFTFPRIHARRIAPLLQHSSVHPAAEGKTLLIAGHDLRFIRGLADLFSRRGYRVLTDKWTGHNSHDVKESRRLLKQADVVIAEWCLGNAVWLSKNVRSDQRLLIRLHLQERGTEFPAKVKLDAVDHVIFVGPHILREVQEKLDWPESKLTVVANYVDIVDFERDKLDDTAFNIAISGISPSRKRYDLALDIFEQLRSRDRRFKLFVKGKMPWDYPWLWKKPSERRYYEKIFERIERSPLLRSSICYDGYAEDVATWYRKVGFVLSTSDFESFHLAIPEGAISGAIPVLLAWDGADQIYPPSWVHKSASAASAFIYDVLMSGQYREIADERGQFSRDNFSLEVIFGHWCDLLEGRTLRPPRRRHVE